MEDVNNYKPNTEVIEDSADSWHVGRRPRKDKDEFLKCAGDGAVRAAVGGLFHLAAARTI